MAYFTVILFWLEHTVEAKLPAAVWEMSPHVSPKWGLVDPREQRKSSLRVIVCTVLYEKPVRQVRGTGMFTITREYYKLTL